VRAASGWDVHRTARAWVELVHRLGYERYGAVGNDGGSMISPEVGRLDPEHVVGVHVTQLFSFPSGDPAEMVDLTPEEQAGLEHLTWFWENLGAFNVMLSQAPLTVAHALYWFTGTSGSSIRFYYEMARSTTRPEGPTTVPTALAASTGDFQSIRRFAERDHQNIVSWNVSDAGGHYSAHSAPELLAQDVTAFFGPLG